MANIATSPRAVRQAARRIGGGGPPGTQAYGRSRPFPSAQPTKQAVMTRGGPAPKPVVNKPVKGPAKKAPAKKAATSGPLRIIRNRRMGRRVGVPRIHLRGRKMVQRTVRARKNLSTQTGRRVIDVKGPRKIIKTKGKTRIVGPRNVLTVTKQGSRIVNKKTGAITKQRFLPGKGSKIVKIWGKGTKTKADDARAVKIRTPKKAVFRYHQTKGDRSLIVRRKPGTPRKVRVIIKNKKGTTRKVIGPKQTRITGPGGKTRTMPTRYISWKRRTTVTPNVREKGWMRGNQKPPKGKRKKNAPRPTPEPRLRHGRRRGKIRAQGEWKDVPVIRRKRRKRGARYNQSLTKGQLKAVTSRNLA